MTIYRLTDGESLFIGTEDAIVDYLKLPKEAVARLIEETKNGGECKLYNCGRYNNINVVAKREIEK